jgi:hypothetical protein
MEEQDMQLQGLMDAFDNATSWRWNFIYHPFTEENPAYW